MPFGRKVVGRPAVLCVDSVCDDRLSDVSATSVEKRERSSLNPGSDQLGAKV